MVEGVAPVSYDATPYHANHLLAENLKLKPSNLLWTELSLIHLPLERADDSQRVGAQQDGG